MSSLWPKTLKGTITTFYSYKGGVGRTMLLANTAAVLASWGHRVLCVDGDLEAPGLHYYLPATPRSIGLLELFESYRELEPINWRDAVSPALLQTRNRLPLDVIRSGRMDDTYNTRVRKLDFADLYGKHQMALKVEKLCTEWREQYDHVLIDSRTGITDIGGILTVQVPDQLLLLCALNQQGIDGLQDTAKRIQRARVALPLDRALLPVFPIATSFAGRFEVTIGEAWSRRFTDAIGFLFNEWLEQNVDLYEFVSHTRIPFVPKWSFGEELPALEEDGRDIDTISYAMLNIAAVIAHRFHGCDSLIAERLSYVRASTREAMLEAKLVTLRRQIERAEQEHELAKLGTHLLERSEVHAELGLTDAAAEDFSKALRWLVEGGENELFHELSRRVTTARNTLAGEFIQLQSYSSMLPFSQSLFTQTERDAELRVEYPSEGSQAKDGIAAAIQKLRRQLMAADLSDEELLRLLTKTGTSAPKISP